MALIRLALAGAVMAATTSAGAAPLRCAPSQAVYQGAAASAVEIEFLRDFTAKTPLLKTGVMRIELKSGVVVDYDVLTAWSKKYARPEVTIRRSASRTQEGDTSRETSPGLMLMFDQHLRPHRGMSAPQLLVIDDIPVAFYYWNEEMERAFEGHRTVPPYAFVLVRCRTER